MYNKILEQEKGEDEMIKRVKLHEKLFVLLFMCFTLFYFTPYLSYNMSPILLGGIFALLVIGAYVCFGYNKFRYSIPTYLIWVFLWLCQMFLYKGIGFSTCSYNKILSHAIMYVLLYVLYRFVDAEIRTREFVRNAVLMIFAVNLLDNIRLNIIYPGASETINFPWGEHFYGMNVGGTPFSLMAALIAMICVVNVLSEQKGRVIWIIYYLACLGYIFLTARLLSVLTMVGGTLLLLTIAFAWKTGRQKRLAIYIILVMIAVGLIFFVVPNILEWFAETIGSERLGPRLRELADILRLQESSVDATQSSGTTRLKLYYMSIQTFLSSVKSFFFGIGEHPAIVEELYTKGIGAHSVILDNLAQYGIIGAICMYQIIAKSYKYFYAEKCAVSSSYIQALEKCIFVIYIVNAIINNVFSSGFFILVFFIVPHSVISRNKVVQRKESTM